MALFGLTSQQHLSGLTALEIYTYNTEKNQGIIIPTQTDIVTFDSKSSMHVELDISLAPPWRSEIFLTSAKGGEEENQIWEGEAPWRCFNCHETPGLRFLWETGQRRKKILADAGQETHNEAGRLNSVEFGTSTSLFNCRSAMLR